MMEGFRPKVRLLEIALSVCVGLAAAGEVARAQSPKAAATTAGKARSPMRPAQKKSAADAGATQSALPSGPAPAIGALGAGAVSDGGVVEAKTLDGGTHVFKFSELDIEGRLKSPQLVYFLRRVRAEFAAGDLGHRSFMREMSETRKESSF